MFRSLLIASFLTFMSLASVSVIAQEHADENKPETHTHDDHAAGAHAHDADGHHEDAGDHDHTGEHHDDHGDHSEGHHDDHAAPPLSEDLSFWSILAFAGFCFAIVKLGLWDSLKTNMAKREQGEIALISTAQNHLAEAQTSLNQYRGELEAMDETLAEAIAEAKRDAAHTESEIIDLANREAKLMVHRAEIEISRTRDQTLNSLFAHLSQRVADAAEVKLRSNLEASDQDRLIDETLNQLVSN